MISILLVACLTGTCWPQQNTVDARKQVVVLYSYRTLMPVNVDRDRGIRRALAEELAQPIDLDIEYLDLSRYGDAEYVRDWIVLLQKKYADRQVDLVLPVAAPAIEFALAHRAVLFPEVPIVFCSAGPDLAERACAEPNVTGVAYRADIDETLQAALDIYPKAEHLLVISGGSDQDKGICELAKPVVAQYQERLDVEYLAGPSLPELLNRMADADPRTVVLMLTFNKDASGNNYVTREVVEKVSDVCPAPVFGLWDTLLGHGIVGGSLIQIEAQGEVAGRMAARVLQGESPSAIPLAGLTTNRLMFDSRQLRRWGIREAALPAGSLVRYREETLWERYGAIVLGAAIVLVVQTVVILALILSRIRRRRAECELAERLQFESLVSDLSSRFVHLLNGEVDEEVEHALRRIAESLDLDGVALFGISPDGTEIRTRHCWKRDTCEHPVGRISRDEISWCWACMDHSQTIHFAELSELPDEAHRERELLQRMGIKSAVAVPLNVSGRTLGLFAFRHHGDQRGWQEATLRQLTLIGRILANALAHAEADEALRVSRTEARQLAGKLLSAQEDERRRLGRELHDDLSQRLAATAIRAGNLEQACAPTSDARDELRALKDSLIGISDDVHQFSRQIHPSILDDLGLADALRSECVRFGERHGCGTVFRCGDIPQDLPQNIALCLYRIAQEALWNAAKHAGADRVDVVLNADAEFVYLDVTDQGCGFEPGGCESKQGLGLASMEERARLVGGELTVTSAPGKGTAISVRVALPEEDA